MTLRPQYNIIKTNFFIFLRLYNETVFQPPFPSVFIAEYNPCSCCVIFWKNVLKVLSPGISVPLFCAHTSQLTERKYYIFESRLLKCGNCYIFRHNRHKSNIKTRKSFWCCRNFAQNFYQYLLYFGLNTHRGFTTTSMNSV